MHSSQVAKEHGGELLPAGESASVPITPVLSDQLCEPTSWNYAHDLTEKAAKSLHRRGSSFVALLVNKTRLRGDPDDLYSEANLDSSGEGACPPLEDGLTSAASVRPENRARSSPLRTPPAPHPRR